MAEAVGGGLVEQLGQLLAEPREVVLRVQRARAVGYAFALVGIDQVDVGTEIELAAAELAHAEHHQPLDLAVGVADHAIARGEAGLQRLQRDPQAGVGQCGAAGDDRLHRVAGDDVAPGKHRGHRVAVAAQQARPVVGLVGGEHRQRQRRGAIVGVQALDEAGLRNQRRHREVAGHRQAPQLVDEAAVGAPGGVLRQACEPAVDGGGMRHAAIVASGPPRYRATP